MTEPVEPVENPTALSSFNENHDLYDQVRPDFLPEAVDNLVKHLELKPGSVVVELAAGTGKFTRSIVNQEYDLVIVEPSAGMLESFRKNFPSIRSVLAGSYSIPLPDGYADAVIIAQAFHWFADHESLAEISRILKPTGHVGMIWNYEDLDPLPESNWQKQITHHVWEYDLAVPQYRRTSEWRKAFEGQNYFKLPYHEEYYPYQHADDKDAIFPYWQSRSYITALPKEEQLKVKQYIEEVLSKVPADELQNGKVVSKRGVHILWASVVKEI